jgi:hypothetical protein
VPVWCFDGSDLDAVAYSVADHQLHTKSQWDEPALAALPEQRNAWDALDSVTFSAHDLDALVAKLREGDER